MADDIQAYDSNAANAGSRSIITKETVGPTKAGLNVSSDELRYTQTFDYSGGTAVIYQGWAEPGTSQGSPAWRVCKYTYDSNGFATDIQWASGTRQFVQIWTSRGSGTYS